MSRILIIDDEEHTRETLRLALSDHDVSTAALGDEGLRLFEGGGWDLVLLDHRMPGLSGLEVLERLHRAAPAVPVILLTGMQSIELSGAALGAGARGFLTKPIALADLRALVAETLGPRKER